ncbi:hypothetical protein [Dictyobacter arantiisoli]|uniref:hypothetical protein n=1 Tax=Dictyobacter arantiisoli TaxID=2014874 RepID=UPI00155A54DE|nr:hypothetical protein [Dictyobacter arantiisoli]
MKNWHCSIVTPGDEPLRVTIDRRAIFNPFTKRDKVARRSPTLAITGPTYIHTFIG